MHSEICALCFVELGVCKKRKRTQVVLPYNISGRVHTPISHLNRLVGITDNDSLVNFRMDQNAFGNLCSMFRRYGSLLNKRFLYVEEQMAIFLGVLAYHKKNRVIHFDYWRSGQIVSKYTYKALLAILKMHTLFIVTPKPIQDDCVNVDGKVSRLCNMAFSTICCLI